MWAMVSRNQMVRAHIDADLARAQGLDAVVPLAPGFLMFLGGPFDPPSTLTDFDKFNTKNQFIGGQVDVRWRMVFNRLSVDLTGMLALGSTQQLVTTEGASTLNTPGAAPVTAPSGILAQTSNMGCYYRSVFSAVPEVGLNLGCTPVGGNDRVTLGSSTSSLDGFFTPVVINGTRGPTRSSSIL